MRPLLLALLALLTSCWRFNNPFLHEQPADFQSQKVQLFDQILDHFSYLPPQFWKQRYYVTDTYFDPKSGPVLLYICGEGICNGVSDQSWTAQLAKDTKALVLALEHRFYGESLPFRAQSFSSENLRLLNSKQALKDLAFFIEELKRNKWHGISAANPWVTIGGSYPGALSAWFRAKYPHLTVGAIASSAVVLAVEDFRDFDEQIFLSANLSGAYCVEAIRTVTEYAEQQSLSDNRLVFQAMFGAEKLSTREFMFYWSDAIVFQVQYGRREAFCASLRGKNLEELLNEVYPLIKAVSPVDYGAYYLASAEFALQDGRGARAWYYQSCTEFSFFQTYSHSHPMRSKLLTLDFYRKWCEDIFGAALWPDVQRTNTEFGGLRLNADNLIMTNGFEGTDVAT